MNLKVTINSLFMAIALLVSAGCTTENGDDNVEREIGGLIAATSVTGCKQGKIITFSQRETFERDGIRTEVMPIWEME